MDNSEKYTPPIQSARINKDISRSIAMDSILQKVPPIEGLFSPDEEVRKLWLIPKEQRRESISIFKDKLSRQREAVGAM